MNDPIASILLGQFSGALSWAPRIFEIIATGLSCFGAYIVSRHGHEGKALIGWQSWVAAGVLWIGFALFSQHWFMAVTQAYFMVTAIQGRKNTVRNMVVGLKVVEGPALSASEKQERTHV